MKAFKISKTTVDTLIMVVLTISIPLFTYGHNKGIDISGVLERIAHWQ